MGQTPSLKPLRLLQTTGDEASFKGILEGGEDEEQPLSPFSRLYHEPGLNVYTIVIMGMKNVVNPDVFKANAIRDIYSKHRFSCLQVLDKENGSMRWVPTQVILDNHFIVPELDPNMELSDQFVEDYISNLTRSDIEPSKPLWDLHILNTKAMDAEATCIFRFHHSLGDGMSLMNILLGSSRKASDLEALPTLPGSNNTSGGHARVTSHRSLFTVLWNSLVALVTFILTVFFLKDTKTPLRGSPGVEDRPRRFVITSLSLDDIKMVKKAMDVTVNDVILGVIKAGLYRYLNLRHGARDNSVVPETIRLRATVVFNLRNTTSSDAVTNTTTHGAAGNKVGYALLPFDIGHKEDLLDYVREVKTDMDRKKASIEPLCTSFIFHLVIKLLGAKFAVKLNHRIYNNTTLALSNVPGPQEEISLFGHEVKFVACTVYGQPMSLAMHVMSYADKVTFVVSADEETVPDLHKLCDDLQHSLHLIKSSVIATGTFKS